MKYLSIAGVILYFFAGILHSQTMSMYCPENHAYIKLGMTKEDILKACGKPKHKETSQQPFTQKIPMLQLMYNNQGSSKAFYGVWTLPVGVTVGSTLTINIVNNKVYSVNVNGGNNKGFSICGGAGIAVGDPVGKVYNACGNPSVINNTYINKQIGTGTYPEIWTYEAPYQPSLRLTFVNGHLESME